MKILVCGDRNWSDVSTILKELSKYGTDTVIIEGACRGADAISGYVAHQLGFRVQEYAADWNKYGRAAGMIRNRQMLAEGKPDMVIAFHSDIAHSKGTKNMIDISEKAGVKVVLITQEQPRS